MPYVLRPTLSRNLFRSIIPTLPPSRNISKITLIGRLGAQPDLVPTSSGQDVVRYQMATDHGSRDDRRTSWWNVVSYPTAGMKPVLLSLGKGSLIFMEGNINMREYVTREGVKAKALNIVQQRIEILQRKDSEEAGDSKGGPEANEGEELLEDSHS